MHVLQYISEGKGMIWGDLNSTRLAEKRGSLGVSFGETKSPDAYVLTEGFSRSLSPKTKKK